MDTNTVTTEQNSCTTQTGGFTLCNAPENYAYVIVGYKNCSQRQRLSSLGLGLGATLEVISNVPGKPLIVFVRGTRFAISRKAASEILVRDEAN